MRYEIILSPDAVVDLNGLPARIRSEVRDSITKYLTHEPKKVSKSRIKRLRGFSRPQYRLRVSEVRVFCDISESTVEVLAIVEKANAEEWLQRYGEP